MTSRLSLLTAAVLALLCAASADRTTASAQAGPDLTVTVGHLASLDYATRLNAARLVRRVPAAAAVAALTTAVHESSDQFVRYRALVLLTGFTDRATPELMRGLIGDHNDRVREVAYRWLEQHPDPMLAPTLLAALGAEQAEFVRPALVRALVVLGNDLAVQRALLAETGRGLDLFRSAVIDALGQARAQWAVPVLTEALRVDGPLQDDVVMALGRIGDQPSLAPISALPAVPQDTAMAALAARCLLGDDCPARIVALSQAVNSRLARGDTVRAGVSALSALAVASDEGLAALDALLSNSVIHDDVVGGIGGAALRNPARLLAWLDLAGAMPRERMIAALREAFERFEEDYAEEQFFAAARAAYWTAPDGSPTRTLMAGLIDTLDF